MRLIAQAIGEYFSGLSSVSLAADISLDVHLLSFSMDNWSLFILICFSCILSSLESHGYNSVTRMQVEDPCIII